MKKKNSEFENLVESPNELPVPESVRRAQTGKGTYRVSLPGLPPMDIEADDEIFAKALYDKFTGVLATSRTHEVEKIK